MLNFSSLLFLTLPFFGWVFLRTLLGITSLVYLLPFSFVFGLTAFLVLVYILAFFLGIYKGSLLTLLILFLIAIFLVLIKIQKVSIKSFLKTENPLKISSILTLLGICLFISFFTYLFSNKWIIWDFKFHISVASCFVTLDKFPQGVSNWPSLFIPYHYGFDLLSAVISTVTNISVIESFQLIVVVSSITTFLSCFAIAYFFTSSYVQALFGSLCFYFAGNLLWFDALIRYLFKIFPVEKDWTLLQTLFSVGLHGSIISDTGSGGVLFTSGILGIQIFLLLLLLFFKYLKEPKISIALLSAIFVASLALFHIAEWILYIFNLAILICPVFYLIIKNGLPCKKLIIRSSICFLLFVIIIVSCKLVYNSLSTDYTYIPTFLEMGINPNLPLIQVFGRFGDLNVHRLVSPWSWDFICEFGLQFIFAIFVLYWAIKTKFKEIQFILAILVISFISPFLLYIKSSPPDVIRLFHPGYELLTLLFIFWLFDLAKKIHSVKYLAIVLSFVVMLPAVSKLVLNSTFSPSIYLDYSFIKFVDNSIGELIKDFNVKKFYSNISNSVNLAREFSVIDSAEVQVASYLKSHSSVNEYGLSGSPFPFDYVGIPSYCALRGSSLPRRITYVSLLRTLDSHLLKELNIRWLYLEPITASVLNFDALKNLIDGRWAKEVLEVNSVVYGSGKLYEFVNLDEYVSTNPRKTYWTFLTYFGQNVICIPDQHNNQVLYLFKTENEATYALKEQIKINPIFKSYKPFIDALDEELIKQHALSNNLVLRYVE